MNSEDRERLIRIDERVDNLNKMFDKEPYAGLVEKVKFHGKIIWSVVIVVLTGIVKSFLK